MQKQLVFNLSGDEEEASSYRSMAQNMADRGVKHHMPNSMTEITIHEGVASIHVAMDCPYHLMVPQTFDSGISGTYMVGLLGYSHRKDALTPSGLDWTAFLGDYGDYKVGGEATYISDGLCLISSGISNEADPDPVIAMPQEHEVVMSINSAIMEDALYAKIEAGNHGGFKTDRHYVTMSRVTYKQGENIYHVIPFGVDRTDPEAPKYVFAIAHLDHPNLAQYYQGKGGDDWWFSLPDATGALVKYTNVTANLTMVAASKTLDSKVTYFMADDMYSLPLPNDPITTTNDAAALKPLIWSVGNMKAIYMYRTITPSAIRPYGGSFTLSAVRIEGHPPTLYTVSTAGLTNTYFGSPTYSQATPDYSGLPDGATHYGRGNTSAPWLFWPWDLQRMQVLFDTLGRNQRERVALSTTETIAFAQRCACHQHPTHYGYEGELVCISITPSGFTQKSVIYTYWSAYCYPDELPPGTRRLWYRSTRAVALDSTTLILFVERLIETASGNNNYVMDGWFRKVSLDGGVTWGPEETITFAGTSQNWMWSRPIAVTTGLAVGLTPMIAGYIEIEYGSGTKTLKKAAALRSEDGGLTWTLSSEVAPDIDYTMATNAEFLNGDGGLGTLHNHGCWEEGYEPSPYKNLPNYFGTPRGICRTTTGDPNL